METRTANANKRITKDEVCLGYTGHPISKHNVKSLHI